MELASHPSSGGTYKPVPHFDESNADSLGARLRAAGAEAGQFALMDHSTPATQAREVRNALVVYAFERGVTIRQLSDLTGLQSTSTIQTIVRGAERGTVLDEDVPGWLR